MLYRLVILGFSILILCGCQTEKMFDLLPANETGITFSNRIIENDSINILSFDYVYNGAGVGVADFNNDGLQDLFFSGNQTFNKLYLNERGFKFKDITDLAGVDGGEKWHSGVAVVDINQDGLMDIYVTATSTNNSNSSLRENTLYVNQGLRDGVPYFKDLAVEYGVNDNGHSENAAFFDYDNDGDLDLYVLTNRIDQYPNIFRDKQIDGENLNTDRLYRNDFSDSLGHPVFTNVSKEAGILIEGHGLGLNISDFNHDGWKDIYVCNDYVSNDLIYINNQDGTFSNKAQDYLKHMSYSSMGNDVADINNDGLDEIVTLDMVPRDNQRKKMFTSPNDVQFFRYTDRYNYEYQYGRNMLQLNNGPGRKFSDISLMADVAETDWSWSPSLADFDNDGYRDLFITNGFPKDVTDKDFMAYRTEAESLLPRKEILKQIPEVKISNYAFRNNGNLGFDDVTADWGLEIPSFSNGAVYADLDNDGDLDYVVNNINDSAFVYRNNLRILNPDKSNYIRVRLIGSERNRNGIGARVEAEYTHGGKFSYEFTPYRGYKSSVEPVTHIGLGADSILSVLRVIWPNGKMQELKNVKSNQVIELTISDADKDYLFQSEAGQKLFEAFDVGYTHNELDYLDYNVQNLIPMRLSQMGPALAVGDVNGDGLEDVFVGGPVFKNGRFLIQKTGGEFMNADLLPAIDSANKISEDIGVLLFDAEGDGDNDLYVVSGGNERLNKPGQFKDRLYVNDGKGNFTENTQALPNLESAGSCVRAADYDGDGDLDLFVSGRNVPHQYPKPTSSYILRNESSKGSPRFVEISSSIAGDLIDIGLVCDALWTDFDNDGDPDLILAGDFMEITVFRNDKGKFSKLKDTGLEGMKGMWNSLQGADFDLDGDIDYIAGNLGQNALFKGTKEYPAVIYSEDFDGNGNYDVIPFVHFSDKNGQKVLVPFNAKEDVHKQLNSTRARFTTFKEFSEATPEKVLTEEERAKARIDELNFVSHAYIENLGGGKFRAKELPMLAQVSTLNGMLAEDFTGDGYPDLLGIGNNYGNELHVGRYDAQNGILLVNDKNGGFYVDPNNGFYVPGDAKALVSLHGAANKMTVLASQNRSEIKGYTTNIPLAVPPVSATKVRYKVNGKETIQELYRGASYLSQKGRGVHIPASAIEIKWE